MAVSCLTEKMKYDARNLEGLDEMKSPKHADEQQQLLCASNWIRNVIPSYVELVAPLQSTMENACNKVEKRPKIALERVDMSGIWGPTQDKAFGKLNKPMADSTRLYLPKESHVICLFRDASD